MTMEKFKVLTLLLLEYGFGATTPASKEKAAVVLTLLLLEYGFGETLQLLGEAAPKVS